jgi:6-phosphogluconolactonase
MAFKMLLSHVPIPKDHLFPMYIAGEQPDELVERYEYLLNQHLGKSLSFDLILLGMCKDGHVASLLPGTDVLKESLRYVYAFKWQNISHITLTASIINKAKKIVVMVYGLNKATMLREVVEGVRNVQKYPAQLLTPENGEILWLTDKAAASKLLISIGK